MFFLDPNRPILLSGRVGSGKTSIAILRAAQLLRFYERQGLVSPKIGFFVFNNTLKVYLETLANLEISSEQYEVSTLDRWCRSFLEGHNLLQLTIADPGVSRACLREAIRSAGLAARRPEVTNLGEDFLVEEVDYLLGRFGRDTHRYVLSERVGRGEQPALDESMKSAIAEEIIPNYQLALEARGLIDWNQMRDQALSYMQIGAHYNRYEIVVVDEAQDLHALQIRIALELVNTNTRAITFVRDGTQRIYKAQYFPNLAGLTLGGSITETTP